MKNYPVGKELRHHLTIHTKMSSGARCIEFTINIQKLLTFFSFRSQKKILVIRAGTHKMLVRIANRKDPDQTASLEAV